jgi:BirA family transcriptional regulator, biotin operon repressor / biotin---[acetyl-CoA-carboxylase] ligase
MDEEGRPGSEQLVLSFLADAGDAFISGEAISDKLGFSRTAVWKYVNALRSQGYRIDAVPARGYRLVEIPDRLGELELRPLLNTDEIGHTLHWFAEVGSTNDVAKRLAEEGAAHGEVVLAEAQSAGRGRRGRNWTSPPGRNVYLSVVLRPDLPTARATEMTLLAAVAVCEVVREAGVSSRIKWPNDVLAGGRKLAGILTELAADPDQLQWLVLGVGVNVNLRAEEVPAEIRDIATSVAIERGQPVPRALFAAALLSALEAWLDRHAADGFEVVREAWKAMSDTLGREVRVRVAGADLEGLAEDIDEAGALLVRTSSGLTRVLAGDVEHLRPR